MNHIRNIVKHPATKEILMTSAQFGFAFGGIFGALKGFSRGHYNNRYTRPKYINPTVYFMGIWL